MSVPATGAFKVLVIGTFANITKATTASTSTRGTAGQAKEVSPYTGIKNAIQAINPAAQVDFMRGFTGRHEREHCGQTVDTTAVNAAANYDYVIVYTGTTADGGTARRRTSTGPRSRCRAPRAP